MVVFTLGILGLVAQVIALPQQPTTSTVPTPSTPPPTPPSTVTVTGTGSPPAEATVVRTITRSIWTSTGTVQAYLNCTRTIYAPVSTTTVAPPILPTSGLLTPQADEINTVFPELDARQDPPSTIITKTLPGTLTLTSTPVERPARTRTTYTIITATQIGAITRTNYQCAATLALQFTVDATTTIQYTLTAYPSTVTATATVNCPGGFGGGGGGGGFGGGGFGGVPTYTPVPLPSPIYTPVPLPSPITTEAGKLDGSIVRRQGNSSSSVTGAPAPTPVYSNGTTATSAIHLTRTAYTLVTLNATSALTATRYECSTVSYDATSTIVVTRTVWPSTITAASVIDCRQPTRPAQTAIPKLLMRQSSSSGSLSTTTSVVVPPTTTAPVTTHRTRYTQTTATVTQTTPYIQIAYSCAPSPPPPPAVTSPTPPPPPAVASP